uniref:Aldo-keto reductase n=1 Tax=Pyricularia oryzae (strain P131) TaxID=1143193 RepID=L7J3E5_PYRO1
MGYRHIDGAHAYGNEKQIGEAIKESGIPREEIFVTSKLAQTWHEPGDVERGLDLSLRNLQLDYGKPWKVGTGPLPHAYKAGENNETIRHPSGNGKPVIDYDLSRRYPETWQAMERLVDSGKAKAIDHGNAYSISTRYLPQHELMEFSAKHGILLMAHQPLGGRPVPAVRGHPDQSPPTEDQTIVDVASSCGMSPAQVCLSWLIQKGIPVIPKSNQREHLRSNMQVRKLSVELFNLVDGLAALRLGGPVRFLDPSRHVGFDIFDEENDQPIEDAAAWD